MPDCGCVGIVDSRATMELQIKTAMQMRDQGHALKQKALDLVSEAEQKVREARRKQEGIRREGENVAAAAANAFVTS